MGSTQANTIRPQSASSQSMTKFNFNISNKASNQVLNYLGLPQDDPIMVQQQSQIKQSSVKKPTKVIDNTNNLFGLIKEENPNSSQGQLTQRLEQLEMSNKDEKFKEILGNFLKKYETCSLFTKHEEIIKSLDKMGSKVKNSIDTNFFIAKNYVEEHYYVLRHKQANPVVFNMFKLLEKLDNDIVTPLLNNTRNESIETQLGNKYELMLKHIINDINQYVPSAIKHISQMDNTLGVVCEGWYKFLVFFFNKIAGDIEKNIQTTIKSICQDRDDQIEEQAERIRELLKQIKNLDNERRYFKKMMEKETRKGKEKVNNLKQDIMNLESKFDEHFNQEITANEIKNQYRDFQRTIREFHLELQKNQEDSEFNMKHLGGMLLDWKKSHGAKSDEITKKYNLYSINDQSLGKVVGKHPFTPILMHFNLVQSMFEKYPPVLENKVQTVLENFFSVYYNHEKIELHNPCEALIMYLLEENVLGEKKYDMSVVSFFIKNMVEIFQTKKYSVENKRFFMFFGEIFGIGEDVNQIIPKKTLHLIFKTYKQISLLYKNQNQEKLQQFDLEFNLHTFDFDKYELLRKKENQAEQYFTQKQILRENLEQQKQGLQKQNIPQKSNKLKKQESVIINEKDKNTNKKFKRLSLEPVTAQEEIIESFNKLSLTTVIDTKKHYILSELNLLQYKEIKDVYEHQEVIQICEILQVLIKDQKEKQQEISKEQLKIYKQKKIIESKNSSEGPTKEIVLNFTHLNKVANKLDIKPLALHSYIMHKYFDDIEFKRRHNKTENNPLINFLVMDNDPINNVINNCINNLYIINQQQFNSKFKKSTQKQQITHISKIYEEFNMENEQKIKLQLEKQYEQNVEDISPSKNKKNNKNKKLDRSQDQSPQKQLNRSPSKGKK